MSALPPPVLALTPRGHPVLAGRHRPAAALDLAVLPSSDRSTNPHGSPVRLFLRLPQAAPLFATPGWRQTDEFAPLATRCGSPAALAAARRASRDAGYDDGRRAAYHAAAREHTWDARAWLPLLFPA